MYIHIPSDPKVWEKLEKDKLIRNPIFWIPALLGLIIVYITPEDIFDNLQLISLIVNFFVDIIPSIQKLADKSSYPSATLILFSYFWALIPYYLVIIFRCKAYEFHFVKTWVKKKKFRHAMPLVIIFMFLSLFLIVYFFSLYENQSCRYFCFYKSKFIQYIYAFSITISVSGSAVMILWWVKNFKFIHLKYK